MFQLRFEGSAMCAWRLTARGVSGRLAEEEGVGAIVNLQEDSDMEYFDLDLEPIRQRCMERGDVAHNRYPIRDFDPFDLRRKLAGAVQLVADQAGALQGTGKSVYIHCTAGEACCLSPSYGVLCMLCFASSHLPMPVVATAPKQYMDPSHMFTVRM